MFFTKTMRNSRSLILPIALTFVVILAVGIRLAVAFQKLHTIIRSGHCSINGFLNPNDAAIQNTTRLIVINQFIPSFQALRLINAGLMPPNAKVLEPYSKYYGKFIEYYPTIPEIYLIQGFCDYFEGKDGPAIADLEEAVRLNPRLFFAHYNLGVIYARRGDFRHAAMAFEHSLSLNPEIAVRTILVSKIYQQIFAGQAQWPHQIAQSLKSAYADSRTGLVLCQQALAHPEQRLIIQKNFSLRLKIL